MMEFSGTMTYGFYGLMSVLSLIFVWKFVPETKGRTLEDMEALWNTKKVVSKAESRNAESFV
jgi:SP family xylose:H+ symportor-like MFS transporter